MMTDEPIGLRLDLSAGTALADRNGRTDRDADRSADAERFRDAMQRPKPGSDTDRSELVRDALPSSAFALFGTARPVEALPTGTPATQGPPTATVGDVLDAVAERILVSADGGREVRIAIRDDVLPGVEVRIVQDQGRWLVDFAVSNAASKELLRKAGRAAAKELARRLSKDIELRIADPHDDGSEAEVFVEFAEDVASAERQP